MAYCTASEIYEYLQQVPVTVGNTTLLGKLADRATAIIDRALGFSYAAYPGSTSAKTIYHDGGSELRLPPYQSGSLASVYLGTVASGSLVTSTDYETLTNGNLLLVTGSGYNPYGYRPWYRGMYTVTAKWGYGEVPADVKEVAIELSVNIWRERDKGAFSDVIGVEGSGDIAVGYAGALTNRQKMILNNVKRQYVAAIT